VGRVPFPSARSFASLARVRALSANGSESLAIPSFLRARASGSLANPPFLSAQGPESLADRSLLSARRCPSLARVHALSANGLGSDRNSRIPGELLQLPIPQGARDMAGTRQCMRKRKRDLCDFFPTNGL
jgi:hypothetical protein